MSLGLTREKPSYAASWLKLYRKRLFEDKGDSPSCLIAAERERLERYFQQCQLLAHRQGIVDTDYIARSGDKSDTVEQRLAVREGSVLECLDLIDKPAAGLASIWSLPDASRPEGFWSEGHHN